MNPTVLAYLPVISPIVTLLVVMLGVFFQNRHVDVRIADVNRLITVESARLEAVFRLELGRLENRVKTIEERSGLIFRP